MKDANGKAVGIGDQVLVPGVVTGMPSDGEIKVRLTHSGEKYAREYVFEGAHVEVTVHQQEVAEVPALEAVPAPEAPATPAPEAPAPEAASAT